MVSMCLKQSKQKIKVASNQSFFDLKVKDIIGKRIDLYIYKNRKAIVVVNVSCKSSVAQQNFDVLNQINSDYRQQGLQIFAFPCSRFGKEQDKSNEEVLAQIQTKYNVQFNILEKVNVNGQNSHPVYKYLRSHSQLYNQMSGKSKKITENFTIFLLNKEGKIVRYFEPSKDLTQFKKSLKRLLKNTNLDSTVDY